MSCKKKISVCKPPVPARPKNLVILNSKHLPKPPETFASENITNFIKDLDLDVKDEENQSSKTLIKQSCEGSDGEEEAFGYLEQIPMNPLNLGPEEDVKLRGSFQKGLNKNATDFSEVLEFEDTKAGQWQRPLPSLPLPPVETKAIVATMPWYKNVDRKGGEEILRNGVNGYFLVRPSSNADTYLTLTLWYGNRVYNIPIRKRKDEKYALGTPKTQEQCFDSVEYLIKNYQSEKLVLYSNGVQTGKTLLTTFPP